MIRKSLLLLLLVSSSLYSQKINLDSYEYIIVADKFDFLKDVDKYQTSSLTKFLLEKKNFKVFLSNEKLPGNLNNNKCTALYAEVKDNSSMFTTKNKIEIKDCYGKILYTSDEGRSKLKEYKKGYHEAIRNAFNTMDDFKFSFKGVSPLKEDVVNSVNKVDIIKPVVDRTSQIKPIIDAKEEVIPNNSDEKLRNIIYAQKIENGYQLVNLKPEVLFIIFRTNKADIYIIKDKNGIFYKTNNGWIAEYYDKSELVQKRFQVNF